MAQGDWDWDSEYFREGESEKGEAFRYEVEGWVDESGNWNEGVPGARDLDDIERLDLHVWNEDGEQAAFSLYGPFEGEDDYDEFWDNIEDFIDDYVYDEDADYALK